MSIGSTDPRALGLSSTSHGNTAQWVYGTFDEFEGSAPWRQMGDAEKEILKLREAEKKAKQGLLMSLKENEMQVKGDKESSQSSLEGFGKGGV